MYGATLRLNSKKLLTGPTQMTARDVHAALGRHPELIEPRVHRGRNADRRDLASAVRRQLFASFAPQGRIPPRGRIEHEWCIARACHRDELQYA